MNGLWGSVRWLRFFTSLDCCPVTPEYTATADCCFELARVWECSDAGSTEISFSQAYQHIRMLHCTNWSEKKVHLQKWLRLTAARWSEGTPAVTQTRQHWNDTSSSHAENWMKWNRICTVDRTFIKDLFFTRDFSSLLELFWTDHAVYIESTDLEITAIYEWGLLFSW